MASPASTLPALMPSPASTLPPLMATIYLALSLLGLVAPHNVGLILNSNHPATVSAIKRVAEFKLSELDNNLTAVERLITKEYDSTYLSLLETICSMMEANVSALISASTSTIASVEADTASMFHVPMIAAVATDPYLKTADRDFLVTLSSSDKYQSQAIFSILKRFHWLRFSILASADSYGMNGVVYLQYLATRDSSFTISDVHHFEVHKNIEEFDISKELALIKSSLVRVVVLNCGAEYAKVIFREAHAVDLMTEGFVWIVTDAITGQPETLSYNGSFPSHYQGIIGTVPHYGEGTGSYNSFKDKYIASGGRAADLSMASVMVADALNLVHQALAGLDGAEWDSAPKVSCLSSDTWEGGETLFKSMAGSSYSGISGDIRLDDNGVAVSSFYDIMNIVKDAFIKVGTWNNSSTPALTLVRDVYHLGGTTTKPTGVSNTLTGYHLRIGIVEENPIALHRTEICGNDTSSPECWFGWNPDIIKRLAGDLNFTYEYVRPADEKYGGFHEDTQTWNGMVKDILDKKTDLTVALSINTIRSTYIDFTLSFFENQASFIQYIEQSSGSAANMFFFLLPFKIGIWCSLFLIIGVISFLVTLLSKLSPYGKYGRKIYAQQTCSCEDCQQKRETKKKQKCRFVDTKEFPCLVEAVEEEDSINDMSFYNSLWTVSTGFVQQGGDTLPHAPSGRFLLFFWWLFVMILVSMYTANLAAYLTLERSTISINTITDLLNQKEYKWGVITDRNTESMMKNHVDLKYTELVKLGFPLDNVSHGVEKVKEGGFIFIDEGSVISFTFKDECDTAETKTDKFSNEWAFGLQPNSPYQDLINREFLRYREEGWFSDIRDTWYKTDKLCDGAVGDEDMRFGVVILSGLYGMFTFGVICSFTLVALETIHAARVDSKYSADKAGFWACLRKRISLKGKEIREEWLGKKRRPHVEGDKVIS